MVPGKLFPLCSSQTTWQKVLNSFLSVYPLSHPRLSFSSTPRSLHMSTLPRSSSLRAGMCGACSSCRRISLSAVKWLCLTGLRKAAGGTGAEEAWLTDWWLSGYVESLRGDERRRLWFHNSPSLVTDRPPPVNSPYISLSNPLLPPSPATTCCCLRLLSVIPLHTLTFSLFNFCSPPLHHTNFLLLRVVHDVNAAAAFVLVRSWPLLRNASAPPAPLFNGFLTTLRGWVRRRRITCCRIPPGQECALVAQSYGEQKWSHFVGIKDRGGRLVVWKWVVAAAAVGAPISLLLYCFRGLSSEWQQIGREHMGIPAKCLFRSSALQLLPWLCQRHRLASNLIFKKQKEIVAFESPRLRRLKVIFLRRGVPCMRQFWITVV